MNLRSLAFAACVASVGSVASAQATPPLANPDRAGDLKPAPDALETPSASAALPAAAGKRNYGSFSELRAEVLDLISASTKRVWLVTDYLTDGETVSALYVAQYRKLDVKVLLGRARANHYMSRLSYLKNQNIPVFLRPETALKTAGPTALLVDGTLALIDGELDFLAKAKRFSLSYASPAETTSFESTFAVALNLKIQAVPQKMPLVGRPNPKGTTFVAPKTPNYSGIDQTGSYNYEKKPEPRPSGVPDKLPKTTKWQQKK